MIEILLCLFIPLAMSEVISAGMDNRFATPRCDHDQLAPAVGNMMTCETNIWNKYLKKMLKQFKDVTGGGKPIDLVEGCKLVNEMRIEAKTCPLNFARLCLPDYIENFVDKIHDAIQFECDCMTTDLECLPGLAKIKGIVQSLLQSCKEDENCPEKLFITDKTCKPVELVGAVKNSLPCLTKPFLPFPFEIIKYFNGFGSLDKVTVCTAIRKVLDECFNENACYSQREMEMIRNMVATVYHRGMGSLVIVTDEFGTAADFLEPLNDIIMKLLEFLIKIEVLPNSVTAVISNSKKVLFLYDHIIEDYKSNECKENQVAFERMVVELEPSELSGSSSLKCELSYFLFLTIAFLMKLDYFL